MVPSGRTTSRSCRCGERLSWGVALMGALPGGCACCTCGEVAAAAATAACHKRSQAETSWAVPEGRACFDCSLQAPRQGSPEYAALYGEAPEGQVRQGCCADNTRIRLHLTCCEVHTGQPCSPAGQSDFEAHHSVCFARPAALLLQEESGKVAAVRRGYQRALLVPSPQVNAGAAAQETCCWLQSPPWC